MTAQPIRILLVEDNPGDAGLVIEMLRDTKIETIIDRVEDGERAILALRKSMSDHSSFDLVLLDLNLPKKNGHDVLKFIRNSERIYSICVVVYTGSSSPHDIRLARENKANGYLIKPMGVKQMHEMTGKLHDLLISVTKGSCSFLDDDWGC